MKNTHSIVVSVVVILLLVTATSFAGLRPANHDGFFIGFGAGGGSLNAEFRTDLAGYGTDSEGGFSGNFYIGWAVAPSWLIGLEGDSWAREYQEEGFYGSATWTFSNATITVWFYPTEYFFLKAGPSFTQAQLRVDVGQGYADYTNEGGGVMIGCGGEFRLTQKFAIVPQLQFMHQDLGSLTDNPEIKVLVNYVTVTVGIGWYW